MAHRQITVKEIRPKLQNWRSRITVIEILPVKRRQFTLQKFVFAGDEGDEVEAIIWGESNINKISPRLKLYTVVDIGVTRVDAINPKYKMIFWLLYSTVGKLPANTNRENKIGKTRRIRVITTEGKPIYMTLWDEYATTHGLVLDQYAKDFSVILGRRLRVGEYNGINLLVKNSLAFSDDTMLIAISCIHICRSTQGKTSHQ